MATGGAVDKDREVSPLRPLGVIAIVVFVVVSTASVWAQGLGYSVWEKPTGEKQPIASFYGHTGLVAIPSALVGPPMSAQFVAHWVNTDWEIGDEEEDLWMWGATAALTGNIEVTALRVENAVKGTGTDQHFDDETVVGVKMNLDLGRWTQNPAAPQLAIGVWDVSDELNRAYYVVMTKELHIRELEGPADLTLTLGFGNNELDRGALDGFFAGVEFSPMPRLKLQAEYDADDFNAVARFYPTPNLSIDVGSMDDDLTVGATYKIGWR